MKKVPFKLNNKVYDVAKWVLIIAVPACITALTSLTMIWNWDIPIEAIVATITTLATLAGALLGISTANYNKEK